MKSKKRILIVDDNNDIRNILSEFLLIQGFEAEIAENGLEALKKFITHPFDLVLTDFHMPYLNGFALAAEIKKRQPKTLIIIMTSNVPMDMPAKNFADHIVEKPFKLNELYTFLQSAIELNAQDSSLQIDYLA